MRTAPLPAGSSAPELKNLWTVSCYARGNCVIGGSYHDTSYAELPLLIRVHGSTASVVSLALPLSVVGEAVSRDRRQLRSGHSVRGGPVERTVQWDPERRLRPQGPVEVAGRARGPSHRGRPRRLGPRRAELFGCLLGRRLRAHPVRPDDRHPVGRAAPGWYLDCHRSPVTRPFLTSAHLFLALVRELCRPRGGMRRRRHGQILQLVDTLAGSTWQSQLTPGIAGLSDVELNEVRCSAGTPGQADACVAFGYATTSSGRLAAVLDVHS